MPFRANARGGIQQHSMSVDQKVEQATNRGEMELLRHRRDCKFVKVLAHVSGRDAVKFQASQLTPHEKSLCGMSVVGVASENGK